MNRDSEGKNKKRGGGRMGRFRLPGSNIKTFGLYSKYNGNMGKTLMLHKGLDFFLFVTVFLVTRKMPGMKAQQMFIE